MTKHIPRKARWTKIGPNEYRGEVGRVFYRNGQWHAELVYRIVDEITLLPGPVDIWSAGKFKRPRNAMIALEDKATELKRRHAAAVTFVSP